MCKTQTEVKNFTVEVHCWFSGDEVDGTKCICRGYMYMNRFNMLRVPMTEIPYPV